MSTRKAVFKYIENKYKTKPDYPWKKYPDYAVFRHNKNDKWFGLVMNIQKNKLTIKGNDNVDILNLKIQPDIW